jgi:hypothetical protein
MVFLSLSLSLSLSLAGDLCFIFFQQEDFYFFCFIDLCGEEDLDGAEAWKS